MPPVWGRKYLEQLGLESWEQLEEMAEQALQEKERQWDAEAEPRRFGFDQVAARRHAQPRKASSKVTNDNEEERRPRTHPRPRRIIKAKVRKTARNKAQHEQQTVVPVDHDSPPSLLGGQDSHGGMSEVRSIDDQPDADKTKSSSGNKSGSAGSEASHATSSRDTASSDDSGTTHHQEATPERR